MCIKNDNVVHCFPPIQIAFGLFGFVMTSVSLVSGLATHWSSFNTALIIAGGALIATALAPTCILSLRLRCLKDKDNVKVTQVAKERVSLHNPRL